MLNGSDLVGLVKYTAIQDVEGHIQYLYEQEGVRLLAYLTLLVSAALATLGGVLIPVFQGGESGAAVARDIAAALVLAVLSIAAFLGTNARLARLPRECTNAKALATLLEEVYR